MNDRRSIIKALSLAGFGLLTSACWLDTDKKEASPLPTINPEEEKENKIKTLLGSSNVSYYYPKSESYEKLKIGFNLNVPKNPKIIALCANTNGIAEAVQLAGVMAIKVAVKSGGHSFESFSNIDGGMQINLSTLKKITWLENNEVQIEPGVLLKELYDALFPKNRLLPAGSCGTVGVGGLALGGGYGFFARKYGLTCDHIQAATFVDGMGKIHQSKDKDDILWMLKGGGNGNMGIVSEFTFRTHEAPKSFTRHRFKCYRLDKERAKSLLQLYFEETKKLPESCFVAFVLNHQTLTVLATTFEEDSNLLQQFLRAFQDVSDKSDLGTPKPIAKALKSYYGVQEPIPFKNASAGYYDSYDTIASSMDAVLDQVLSTKNLIYQINTLGGAIASKTFAQSSSYPHRDSPYLSELQAYWNPGQSSEKIVKAFDRVQDIFYQNGIRKQYRNYPNTKWEHWEEAYYGEHYTRLQALKRKYDPNTLFEHVQTVRG